MKKRLSALTLTLLLLLSVLPLSAGAAYLPFTDIPEDHYARSAVQYVYDNGLMNGVSSDRFGPESDFTRAMFVTILGRMDGVDPAKYTGSPFSDVSAKTMSWAAPYIQWASENNIVNGVGSGKFNPNGTITREQYCTIILRYFNTVKPDADGMMPLSVYLSDGEDISSYAEVGVRTLVGFGLIDLYPGREFLPQHRMSRAEIAETFSLVHRFLNTGMVPGFQDNRGWYDQTVMDIEYAVRDTVQFTWDWYTDCLYVDPNQTVGIDCAPFGDYVLPNWPHEKVIAIGVNSMQDLRRLASLYYTDAAVAQLEGRKSFSEQYGSLYISREDGLGGFAADNCDVDIIPINDDQYDISFKTYVGREPYSTYVAHYVFRDSRWMFTEPLPLELQGMPFAYG